MPGDSPFFQVYKFTLTLNFFGALFAGPFKRLGKQTAEPTDSKEVGIPGDPGVGFGVSGNGTLDVGPPGE